VCLGTRYPELVKWISCSGTIERWVVMDLLRATFKALSDETRLQIVTLLLDNDELCVCDFVGALGETQSKISRHLRYLYNAGLVKDRRQGLWIHYRLSPDLAPEQKSILDTLARVVSEESKESLRDSLERWFDQKPASGPDEAKVSCC
jgi:ArsR family transcriptional regulator